MQLPIPDDWDGVSTCRWAVCWPDSPQWKAILYGLLESPNQGRFWDFRTGNFLSLRNDFRPVLDYNFKLKGVIMACDDSGLSEGLQAIAEALQAMAAAQATAAAAATVNGGGCCDEGSGGAGGSAPPLNPLEPGDPAVDPPPTGFPDWPAYDANRCAVATDIIDTLIGDIGRMRTLNLLGLILATLIPLLIGSILTPIPGDEIAVLGGIILLSLTLGSDMIATWLSTVVDGRDELICALYESGSAASAEAAVEAKFNEIWDENNPGSIYGFSAKSAWATMVNPAVVNRLVELDTDHILPPGDCTGCQPPPCWNFVEDVDGWYAPGDNWSSFDPGEPVGSVEWVSGERLRITMQNVGGNQYACASSPEFSHLVAEGDYFCVNINSASPVNVFTLYAAGLFDGEWVNLVTPVSGNVVGEGNWGIDTHAGETLTRIQIAFGRGSNTAAYIDLAGVCLNSETCE